MKGLKSQMKERIQWRRNKVQELVVKGRTQAHIAKELQISEPTVSRDAEFLKEEARKTIKNHIQERLPFEYNNCLQGLQEVTSKAWTIADNAEKAGERLQALSLIKDCYSTKMDLLTNANLLSDSIKFLEENREKLSNIEINDKVHKQNSKDNGDINDNDIQGFSEVNRPAAEPTNTIF